jgi:lipid A 3-O-deacylase
MFKYLFLVILLVPFVDFAQKRPAEFGLVLDNDLYTSTVSDKYYTNGFEIFYKYLDKGQGEKINKRITEFRIGQYIYNPYNIKADDISRNDRPFAGYLFGRFGKHTFYQDESVLKLNFQAGYVGPNAFGREMQELFHRSLGYIQVKGWQHQIKNALALQVNAFYSKKIFCPEANDRIDFHAVGDINAGTVNSGVSIGVLSRLSLKKLLPIYNSNLYNAAINIDPQAYKTESECYLYIAPYLNYQLYDATIQGSLFNNNSPVTYDVVPFRFNGEAGIKYRKNHWDFSYAFVYKGKELKNDVVKGSFYGSIIIGYLLH